MQAKHLKEEWPRNRRFKTIQADEAIIESGTARFLSYQNRIQLRVCQHVLQKRLRVRT